MSVAPTPTPSSSSASAAAAQSCAADAPLAAADGVWGQALSGWRLPPTATAAATTVFFGPAPASPDTPPAAPSSALSASELTQLTQLTQLAARFPDTSRFFSLTAWNPANRQQTHGANTLANNRLAAQLRQAAAAHGLSAADVVLPSYSWALGSSAPAPTPTPTLDWCEHGFTVAMPAAALPGWRDTLMGLARAVGQAAIYDYELVPGVGLKQRVVDCAADRIDEETLVVPLTNLEQVAARHPLTLDPPAAGIFRSHAAALAALREAAAFAAAASADCSPPDDPAAFATAVDAVLGVVQATPAPDLGRLSDAPFVVVEGLDGVGKSTLARRLAEAQPAGQPVVVTPPTAILPQRMRFDKCGVQRFRRAYYCAGNYIAYARDIAPALARDTTTTTAVVVDRFFFSTVAYALAASTHSIEELPPVGSPIYQWPPDLPRPAGVVFVSADRDVRSARLRARHQGSAAAPMTAEEEQLLASAAFEQLLLEVYHRLVATNRDTIHCEILDTSTLDAAAAVRAAAALFPGVLAGIKG